MLSMHMSRVLTYLLHCNNNDYLFPQKAQTDAPNLSALLVKVTIMLVSAILRVVMRIVNATARANQLRAERTLNEHLARAGKRLA